MKKYSIFLMALLAVSALTVTSCSDKDDFESDGYNSDRLFMPMFRLVQNTGTSTLEDPVGCGAAYLFENAPSNRKNDIWLNWYEVDGASGYQLQCCARAGGWDDPNNIVLDIELPAGTHSYLHEDLAYNQGYYYAIRALSPKGEAYHSKWYGKGAGGNDLRHPEDMSRDRNSSDQLVKDALMTGERYAYPDLFWISDVTENSLKVYFNRDIENVEQAKKDYANFLKFGGEIDEAKKVWVFDEIVVEPTTDNPGLETMKHKMEQADYDRGYVEFTGLVSNASYLIQGMNNHVARYYDRDYGKITARMHGQKGEPFLVRTDLAPTDGDSLFVTQYIPELKGQYTRLDTVLINYMSDNTMAEGQIFYLEGGKTYYINSTVSITKGFTLETDPATLSKGRAVVLLGLGYTSEAKTEYKAVNFNLSRPSGNASENGMQFTIDDVKFNNINFTMMGWTNHLDKNSKVDGNSKMSINGNYFINMDSKGLSFSLNELGITNCTFSGQVRGFIRFQGSNRQIISRINCDNCVFYDCGLYADNGEGYAWFDGPGNNKNSNFFQDLRFTNNTIIDSPRRALVKEAGDLSWPRSTKWNITIENNTFVNFNTRNTHNTRGCIFETNYAPAGSSFTVKKNLFIWTRKGDKDDRAFNMKGMTCTTSSMKYDFADNYSTYIPAWGTHPASDVKNSDVLDHMFTNKAFYDGNNGAGRDDGELNASGMAELHIKFGDNINGKDDMVVEAGSDNVGYQLKAEELCKNPQPLDVNGTKNMNRHNIDGFYYNMSDPRVANHPIVKKKIGDQRWATGKAWK